MTREELEVIKKNVEVCRPWMNEHSMLVYQSHVDKLIVALEEAWAEKQKLQNLYDHLRAEYAELTQR